MDASNFNRIQLSPKAIAWLEQHLNVHRVIMLLCLACFFIAWNRGLALLYGLFSFLLSLLIISYIMPYLQLRSLSVVRSQASRLQSGEYGEIQYRVISRSKHHQVELIDHLPTENNASFVSSARTGLVTLMTLQFNRRGCYKGEAIQACSAYPFGIYRVSRLIPLDSQELIVYPKVVELSGFPFPTDSKYANSGESPLTESGEEGECISLREYRRGDPLKKVHWASSARLNRLLIRENERLKRPHLLIILNCDTSFQVGSDQHASFEVAIVLAASLVQKSMNIGVDCRIIADADPRIDVSLSPNCGSFDHLLDALARISTNRSDYTASVNNALKNAPESTLVATFRLDDQTPIGMPEGVLHIDFVMDKKSFSSPATLAKQHRLPTVGHRKPFLIFPTTRLEQLFDAY